MEKSLMNLEPKTSHEKLLWERLRTEELNKEIKRLRNEIGVLNSEIEELKYLMKTEQIGALILKNRANVEKNMILEASNKKLKIEHEKMFLELIKLRNK